MIFRKTAEIDLIFEFSKEKNLNNLLLTVILIIIEDPSGRERPNYEKRTIFNQYFNESCELDRCYFTTFLIDDTVENVHAKISVKIVQKLRGGGGLILPNSPKNCMKLKEFGHGGGGVRPSRPT